MTTFPKVSPLFKGYETEAVDTFLEQAHELYDQDELPEDFNPGFVREQTFPVVHGGYSIENVDAVLDRLDNAFGQRLRAHRVETEGQDAWLDQTYEQAKALYPRLNRTAGERFNPPSGRRGYRYEDVDKLLARVKATLAGDDSLTSDDVVRATFRSARRSKAYDMAVVDAFLDRIIFILRSTE